MEPKHLALLRHAKSSWDDPDLADHDRPLTSRGRRAATRIGQYMRQTSFVPDLVLCSSATRAGQTLELLRLEAQPEVLVENEIYAAGAGELLARLRRITDGVDSVLMVGHNPGLHELAITLADDEGMVSFPTAALAELRVPILTWVELRASVANLHAFTTPKSLH
jgi:phosphohistidine phosphatase